MHRELLQEILELLVADFSRLCDCGLIHPRPEVQTYASVSCQYYPHQRTFGPPSDVLFYESLPLLINAGVFIPVTHLFVMFYEEPTLRRPFGQKYEAYCSKAGRCWPSTCGIDY